MIALSEAIGPDTEVTAPMSLRHGIIPLAQAAAGLAGMEARFIVRANWARPIARSRAIRLEAAEARAWRALIPIPAVKPAPQAPTAARVALSLALAGSYCGHALLAET